MAAKAQRLLGTTGPTPQSHRDGCVSRVEMVGPDADVEDYWVVWANIKNTEGDGVVGGVIKTYLSYSAVLPSFITARFLRHDRLLRERVGGLAPGFVLISRCLCVLTGSLWITSTVYCSKEKSPELCISGPALSNVWYKTNAALLFPRKRPRI